MKKLLTLLVLSLPLHTVQALEIGKGKVISSSTQMIEIFVSEERAKYGDVSAECTLFDNQKNEIDTVKTRFIQDRMPLHFKGRYWHVYDISCRLFKPKTS
ncbi:hypothetical protein [Endozoicomonas sp. 2B-B]